MSTFRFVILGAGGIAEKFCDAVRRVPGCEAAAVASKSLERAKRFAERSRLAAYYDSYEEMLLREKPDAAYIAVTHDAHFPLLMLCIKHGVPVLCEKCLCMNGQEARTALAEAEKQRVFVMEAMWSRFLPAVRKAREWVRGGRIGMPELSQFLIGFHAEEQPDNRYYSRALGGGAARDLGVYGYELTTYVLEQEIRRMTATATWSETGVDTNDHITIEFEHTLADIMASIDCALEERMIVYGKQGKIVLPQPHFASECMLYGGDGQLLEHFRDTETQNGFVYEIEETVRCVRGGVLESPVVPHALTIACAELFDLLEEGGKEA